MYTVHSFNNDKAYNGNFGRSNSSALLLHYFAQHFLLFPRVNPYVKFNILLKLKLNSRTGQPRKYHQKPYALNDIIIGG